MVEMGTFPTVAAVLLLGVGTSAQVVFDAADVSGAFQDPNGADLSLPTDSNAALTLTRPDLPKKGNLVRLCECSSDQPEISSIRDLSNKWLAGGTAPTSYGFTNLVWSWGQFIDHDIVATVDGDDDLHEADIITLTKRGMSAMMRLHRLISDNADREGCPSPVVVNTPIVDAGTVYSNEASFLRDSLRLPNSCALRTSAGNMLPISTVRNKDGHYVFIAGDARVDEHAVLTMMHTVWLREHNRLCDAIEGDSAYSGLSNNQKFDLAKNVVIAKIQDITVREWLPLLGISEADLRSAAPLSDKVRNSAAISVEFSTAAYRFGHDMVPDTMGPKATVDLFDGNAFFGIQNSGSSSAAASLKLDDVALFTAQSRANQIDGKLSDTLRDTLFGDFGEDLGSRNMYRSRDMRIPSYGALAACYGVDTAGKFSNDALPFLGLLKDNPSPRSQVFGPVQRAVLIEQFHRIFFGSAGDWWEDRLGDIGGFKDEVHAATIGSVINDNTFAFVQPNAFKLGGGGGKTGPSGSGGGVSGGGDDEGSGGDDGTGGSGGDDGGFDGGFEFPDFPDGFPQFR